MFKKCINSIRKIRVLSFSSKTALILCTLFSLDVVSIPLSEISVGIDEDNIGLIISAKEKDRTNPQSSGAVKGQNGELLVFKSEIKPKELDSLITDEIKDLYLFDVEIHNGVQIDLPDNVRSIKILNSSVSHGVYLGVNLAESVEIISSKFNGSFELYGGSSSSKASYLFLENQFMCLKGVNLIDFSELYGESFLMEKNIFGCEISMMDLVASKSTRIVGSVFNDGITIINSDMTSPFEFYFNTVNGPAFFPSIDFKKSFSLSQSKFSDRVVLSGSSFFDEVNLTWAKFNGGLDLQFTNFGRNSNLEISMMEVPQGKLDFDIDEFERVIHKPLMVGKENLSERKKEIIYESFLGHYSEKGKKQEFDTVSHFYEDFKYSQNPSVSGFFYGLTMGYGYELWRYVLVVVLPIVLLCSLAMFLLFNREIHGLVSRVNQTNLNDTPTPRGVVLFFRTLSITSSILFSIRFKTLWLSENHRFNAIVLCQFILGLCLYLAFLVGTKTSSFDVIKAIAGF